jgi:hypothetical protein
MKDTTLKEMCIYLGIQLPAEAYDSRAEMEKAADVQRDLPPCIDSFCVAAEAAMKVLYSHESRGDTSSPVYENAVETAWMAVDLVVAFYESPDKERPFQTRVGRGAMRSLPDCISIGGPSCIDREKMRAGIYGGILSGIGSENAGHRVIPTLHGVHVDIDPRRMGKPPGSTRIH